MKRITNFLGSLGSFSFLVVMLVACFVASVGAQALHSPATLFLGTANINDPCAPNYRHLGGWLNSAGLILTCQGTKLAPMGPVVTSCGTTAACGNTTISGTAKVVTGNVALTSATPSTATITGLSPAFTSNTSYHCLLGDETTRTNQVFVSSYASGSSFVITGPTTVTDTVSYVCIGN